MASGSAEGSASLETIQKARETIAPHAKLTPILTCSSLDALSDRILFFKCESMQKGGSFKFRGACNAVFSLSDAEASNGIVTHSSGNHGGSVALAAKLRGIKAHVVVPRTTPKCKIEAITAYGGHLLFSDRPMDAREAACAKVMQETGAVFIPPFNHPHIISGQGTMGLEILEQIEGGIDAVVVPVSGGGMISGIAVAIKSVNPGIKVIAAEPTGTNNAADVAQCKAQGKLVVSPQPKTIADGLMGRLGSLTWPIVRDLVDAVVTVSEEEIISAMALIFERMKVVVEPSGAVGLAAVLSETFQSDAQFQSCARICVLLSGGNVDMHAKGFWNPKLWEPE